MELLTVPYSDKIAAQFVPYPKFVFFLHQFCHSYLLCNQFIAGASPLAVFFHET